MARTWEAPPLDYDYDHFGACSWRLRRNAVCGQIKYITSPRLSGLGSGGDTATPNLHSDAVPGMHSTTN
jgi:hypothetical protein